METAHKLLVMSGKGGVGKTTVAVNLACALAGKGLRIGLLDADIHGPNVPKMLHLEDQRMETRDNRMVPVQVGDNLSVVSLAFLLDRTDATIWRGPMKHNVIRQFVEDVIWDDLDYLVIDLPPGTGDEAISVSQLLTGITGSIIVSTPQEVALLDAARAVDFSRKVEAPIIGLIENMSGEVFGEGGVEKVARKAGVAFLGRLGLQPQIRESGDTGIPFASTGAFDAIAERVRDACENQ
jgi:ATP-binding protein involved in chromosome partitioning